MPIRVALFDEQPLVLRGLQELFQSQPDIEVVGAAHVPADALQVVQETRPDVLVFDLPSPRARTVAFLRGLQRFPATHLVLLTIAPTQETLKDAVHRGVQAVVLKDMKPEGLLAAVRDAYAGRQTLLPELARTRADALSPEQVVATLTRRERQVVELVALGLRNKVIADRLAIKEDTVKMHLRHVYDKLSLRNRVELANYARKHGLA